MSLSSIEGYKLGADLDDVYQDFYNLGRIFQVEDRAEEVVNGMKEKVAEVEKKIEGTEPVRVFVFDYLADDGPYTCGNNFTAQLIRHAGGENIFIPLKRSFLSSRTTPLLLISALLRTTELFLLPSASPLQAP